MRIAHIVRRYAASEWGGTETVVCHTVEEQMRRGDEPRIFCTSALQKPDGKLAFSYVYPYFPMPAADRLALDKKGGSPYSPALFRAVRTFRPDLIHIHAGGRLATAAVKQAKALGVPSVMSLHGGAVAVPQAEMDEMLRPLKGKFPYGGILDRLFGLRFDPLARVDAVICISRTEEKRLNERYPGQRIRYLPNGVAAAQPVPAAPHDPAHVELLCVSRIDYQKNQLALVETLARLNAVTPGRYRLTLIGPLTARWYHDEIVARVKALGQESAFTLIPGLAPGSAELERAFASADLFVLPSVHEPFGIVALEAMQRGVPLVSSNVGGLPDFVRDGVNGLLFDPAEPESLDRAIRRLAEDAALRRAVVAEGRLTAADYAWPKVIDRLEAIYREVKGIPA